MSRSCENKNPLVREGSVQKQRIPNALLPQNLKIHELVESDWLKFAGNYARLLKYFEKDVKNPTGSWEGFFPEEEEIEKILSRTSEGEIQPHLSLFISFLKLLKFPQSGLNEIPKRHLDFYYRDVLRMQPKAFKKDFVHVIFEVAKNTEKALIQKGSLLEAGKDERGMPRFYSTVKDLVANHGKVAAIKSVYADSQNRLKFAPMTNSKDGLGETLDPGESFAAFGDDQWPVVPLQFYLSSPVLRLDSGKRNIEITWTFDKKLELKGAIMASVTQEKGWLKEMEVTSSGGKNEIWTVELSEDEKAVTPYHEKMHTCNLDTLEPVIRLRFTDPQMYQEASKTIISNVKIKVSVENLKDVILRNGLGNLRPDKPFMPFGPRPKKKSKLKITAPEFEGKKIDAYTINLPWLNLPANFTNYYHHYDEAIQAARLEELQNLDYHMVYLAPALQNLILEGDYVISIDEKQEMELAGNISLGKELPVDPRRKEFKIMIKSPYNLDVTTEMFPSDIAAISVDGNGTYQKGREIELQLLEPFYHDLYNNIYVSVITNTSGGGVNPEDLPNEPYTPLLNHLSLNYEAHSKIGFTDDGNTGKEVEFFHGYPFGNKKVESRDSLLPYFDGHQLFIGIEGVRAKDHISLLFQVEEGSENPATGFFAEHEAIKWSVLGEGDQWVSLKSENIIQNNTNNFLRSGIIEIGLPKETSLHHSLFHPGLVWLRMQLHKSSDSVARFMGIHAQAALAAFEWKGNSVEHMQAGLPQDTIKQLSRRKSGIKSVSQPYPSFGGKPAENDKEHYRRTSERLRHKDRALSIWDYERIVLQEFPTIYKVKCLNHTKLSEGNVDELYPGSIILLVIPRLSESNTTYRLKPMVSQDVKDRILRFLEPRMPLHVELEVHNPIYEEVRFQFKVRFHQEYEFDFYRTKLQEELKNYLAPWGSSNEAEVIFSNSLYRFEVIHFIENLHYVDYIEDFKMALRISEDQWLVKKEITPSTSLSILVPSEQHIINEASMCQL